MRTASSSSSHHPQIAGYTLALYGLNMYHGYRAWPKDGSAGPINFRELSWVAATDMNMRVMVFGMVALSTSAKQLY